MHNNIDIAEDSIIDLIIISCIIVGSFDLINR